MAVAIATGAFGIFYGTLAPVSDALSGPRLLLISALVTCLLTAWLIMVNRLWNRQRTPSQIWRHGLDNTSTVITVGVDRKSTRLNSSHVAISYAVFCLTKKH